MLWCVCDSVVGLVWAGYVLCWCLVVFVFGGSLEKGLALFLGFGLQGWSGCGLVV